MTFNFKFCTALFACMLPLVGSVTAFAQEQMEEPRPPTFREQPREPQPSASASKEQAPELLTQEQLEVLVARIALYPDELVAVISAASLYPLQIVEAARYLENKKSSPTLKPKDTWDGSVISLLNYPEILKMMSDDLDWTQSLAEALTSQQKDVLLAIQELREKAVAEGVIKTDDKIKVAKEADKIVIEPTSPEAVYVPRYEPEMLYEPGFAWAPIDYYPYAYPNYYYPTAPYFAAFVTGVIWAAVIDWDDWGIWGGDWDDDDIHIHCRHCFKDRDFDRKIRWKDVDWKKVDRNKIKLDEDQLTRIDRRQLESGLKTKNRNDLKNKSAELRKTRALALTDKTNRQKDLRRKDVHRDVAEGLESTDKRRKLSAEISETAGNNRTEKFDREASFSKRVASADNSYQKAKKIRSARKSKQTAKAAVRAKKHSSRAERKSIKKRRISSRRARGTYGLGGGGKKIKKKRGRRRG